jgi:hypothetical protein
MLNLKTITIMKKFFSLCLCLFLACNLSVNAQSKGDFYVGGNLQFGLTALDMPILGSETSTNFGITPEVGYFVADKLKIGMDITYYYSTETHQMHFMPNIAYYVPIVKNLYYVPELAIGGGFIAPHGESEGLFTMSLKLASLEYRPTSKFAFGVGLINLDYSRWSEINLVNFGILSSPTVSFKYFF